MHRFRGALGMLVGLGILVAGGTGPALSDDVSVLAGSCANCHGTDGRSPGSIGSIAGQPAAVLSAQLKAFKANEIPNTTVMNRIAKGYTDEQIEALARHFSQIKD